MLKIPRQTLRVDCKFNQLDFDENVTGSGKRDIFSQTMIFQYKRCCSKKRNIIYYSKKFFFGLTVSTTLYLHSHQTLATERPSNWSSALLKDGYLNLLLQSKNVVKRG